MKEHVFRVYDREGFWRLERVSRHSKKDAERFIRSYCNMTGLTYKYFYSREIKE